MYEDLFLNGDFIPVEVGGEHSESVIAYARKYNNSWAITVAPRFLTKVIKDTALPLGKETWKDTYIRIKESNFDSLTNVITLQNVQCKDRILLGEVFSHFPGALLYNFGIG